MDFCPFLEQGFGERLELAGREPFLFGALHPCCEHAAPAVGQTLLVVASLACKALQPFSLIVGMKSLNNKERTCALSRRVHI